MLTSSKKFLRAYTESRPSGANCGGHTCNFRSLSSSIDGEVITTMIHSLLEWN
jgi:hypothetical protein